MRVATDRVRKRGDGSTGPSPPAERCSWTDPAPYVQVIAEACRPRPGTPRRQVRAVGVRDGVCIVFSDCRCAARDPPRGTVRSAASRRRALRLFQLVAGLIPLCSWCARACRTTGGPSAVLPPATKQTGARSAARCAARVADHRGASAQGWRDPVIIMGLRSARQPLGPRHGRHVRRRGCSCR